MDESEIERTLLMSKINESNLVRKFEDDLMIFDCPPEIDNKEISVSEKYKLFKEMKNLTIFDQKRNKQYTKLQTLELEALLNKYPNHIKNY